MYIYLHCTKIYQQTGKNLSDWQHIRTAFLPKLVWFSDTPIYRMCS